MALLSIIYSVAFAWREEGFWGMVRCVATYLLWLAVIFLYLAGYFGKLTNFRTASISITGIVAVSYHDFKMFYLRSQ